jgi:hypothetical protein
MTKLFLTNFETCLLKCSEELNTKTCTLLSPCNRGDFLTYESTTLQLGFGSEAYENGGTVFKCNILDARDGGRKYIILTDLLLFGSKSLPQSFMSRYDILVRMVKEKDFFDEDYFGNEYRLRVVDLFEPRDALMLHDVIMPNYFGYVYGVDFTSDALTSFLEEETESVSDNCRDLILSKSKFTDVYTVTSNGITKVKGSAIAFIPNIQTSLALRKLSRNKTNIKVKCTFNTKRQKWVPHLA